MNLNVKARNADKKSPLYPAMLGMLISDGLLSLKLMMIFSPNKAFVL